jgi:DNA-damage-inducible protein D
MGNEIDKVNDAVSPFERIRRTNDAGAEYWSSRDFAGVLAYTDYRNFEQVVGKARLACFNSGRRVEDHFVDITEMVAIGSGAERPVKTVLLSRYACYLIVQNAGRRNATGRRNGRRDPTATRGWRNDTASSTRRAEAFPRDSNPRLQARRTRRGPDCRRGCCSPFRHCGCRREGHLGNPGRHSVRRP